MFAANFSDPENARIIYMAAGGLVVLAIGLVVGTVWWWRSSAVEHPALGPLEVMGSKSFLVGDDDLRNDLIQSARPDFAPDDGEHALVLHESFDEAFPEGVPTPPPAPVAAPRAPRRQPAPELYDDLFDAPAQSYDEPFDDSGAAPYDDSFAGGADPWNEPAPAPAAPARAAAAPAAADDLDAMADDIWGVDDHAQQPTARPIDPLLRSDDIW